MCFKGAITVTVFYCEAVTYLWIILDFSLVWLQTADTEEIVRHLYCCDPHPIFVLWPQNEAHMWLCSADHGQRDSSFGIVKEKAQSEMINIT